jgi:two-component system, chemotaxis family, chemotaxis protein CheY
MVISNIRTAAKFKQTVLIIDDQPTVLAIHSAIIKSLKLNLNVVTMTNPVDALVWIKNRQVDLIITDFKMKEMDGLEFVSQINQTNFAIPKPIIVISVIKEPKIHKALMAAGAYACLTKPANASTLAKMARFLLQESNEHHINKKFAIN